MGVVAWWPSWSCDLDQIFKLSPFAWGLHTERSPLKMLMKDGQYWLPSYKLPWRPWLREARKAKVPLMLHDKYQPNILNGLLRESVD